MACDPILGYTTFGTTPDCVHMACRRRVGMRGGLRYKPYGTIFCLSRPARDNTHSLIETMLPIFRRLRITPRACTGFPPGCRLQCTISRHKSNTVAHLAGQTRYIFFPKLHFNVQNEGENSSRCKKGRFSKATYDYSYAFLHRDTRVVTTSK